MTRVHVTTPVVCIHCGRPLAYLELHRAIERAMRRGKVTATVKHAHCGLLTVIATRAAS